MITHLLSSLEQPDSSVEPFFNSVVQQLGIPDIFSLQMCGAGLSASSTADPAGGSLVSSQERAPVEDFDQINISNKLYIFYMISASNSALLYIFCLELFNISSINYVLHSERTGMWLSAPLLRLNKIPH